MNTPRGMPLLARVQIIPQNGSSPLSSVKLIVLFFLPIPYIQINKHIIMI